MRPHPWHIVLLSMAACTQASSPAEEIIEETDPIIGGVPDSGDPSVVALYAQPAGSQDGFLCTGSIIAPTIVLTAAHCVAQSETGAGVKYTVIAGPSVDDSKATRLAVRSVHPNPRWNADALEAGHDQGVVVLREPTTLRPLPINRAELPSAVVGQPLRLVGYGLDNGSLQTGAGVKRQALTAVKAITDTLMQVGTRRRGTCNGDSGGPSFMTIDGVETIVGTTSYGNHDCTDGGFNARVDTDLDFIDKYLGDICAPSCDGRSCGPDGCGGFCGNCDELAGAICSASGQCVTGVGGCDNGGREKEPNDSALQASELCAGGTSRGVISASSDQDWFTWSVNPDSVYTVSITPAGADPAIRVYKIAATGRLSFVGDGPVVTRHTDIGGTYVARVNTAALLRATYTVKVATTQ